MSEPTASEWFSTAQLAALRLPELPSDKRSLNRLIAKEHWSSRHLQSSELLARPRSGRGGGIEYHVSLLPPMALLALARRGQLPPRQPEMDTNGAYSKTAWRWFNDQSLEVRKEAQRRLAAVGEITLLESAGTTRTAAIAIIASDHSVGKSTLWHWLRYINGVARGDWLPALAPRRKLGVVKASRQTFAAQSHVKETQILYGEQQCADLSEVADLKSRVERIERRLGLRDTEH